MLDFPLDQDHLLWLLDEMYYSGETAAKTILESVNPYFKNARTLMIDVIDPNKFIAKNPSTKEVTNSITFSRGNRPTEDGLLSEVIFGITQEERANIYGYIDLDEQFINPFLYDVWLSLDRYLRPCVYETDTFILDKDGYLQPDPNGETGLQFLIKNQKKLQFKKTGRTDHLNALFHARDNGTLFANKLIVIPPYYRDVNTRDGGRVGIGEINKLYKHLIECVKALRDTRLLGLDMLGAARGKIQDTLLHIHNWFVLGETATGEVHAGSGIFKKFGIMRRAVMAKTTDYASRLVLSAQVINVESREDMICDMDHASVPLAAAVTISYPFMCYYLSRWFENNFTPGGFYEYYDENNKLWRVKLKLNNAFDFSNDRFDKELNEYIHGYSRRFKPIELELENGDKINLRFKGYNITEKEYLEGKREDTSRLIERDFTWLDLFYICACEATKDRVAIITRYPINLVV